MNSDTIRAKSLLISGAYTCVLCKGDQTYTTAKRGILPLVEWLDSGMDLKGASAADKIVGKAAAYLYILMGVTEVYASVMSTEAAHLLSQNGITNDCGTSVTAIINRAGTGLCPMEQAVQTIHEPHAALCTIKQTLESLC